jgi:flagellin-like hook-associated protein FlgL
MISINVNPAASGAGLNLGKSNEALQKSLARLSIGRRIVNSSDDAGGLAVSMKMAAAQKRTEATAINLRNVNSYLDTQDGAFSIADKVMSRMSELSSLARDVTKNQGDIENYNKEFENLKKQLTSLAAEKFNGQPLFSDDSAGEVFNVPTSEDGSQLATVTRAAVASDPMMYMMVNGFDTFQVTDGDGNTRTFIAPLDPGVEWGESLGVAVTFGPAAAGAPVNAFEIPGGVGSAVNVDLATGTVVPYNSANALGGITVNGKTVDSEGPTIAANTTLVINPDDEGATTSLIADSQRTDLKYSNSAAYAFLSQEALQQIADMRAQNGAEMSRINFAQDLLNINATNLEAANSRIMDVDVASESSQLARFQILQQAGTAMLAQANTSQQSLIKLLQG